MQANLLTDFRKLTPIEEALLNRLLDADFPGKADLGLLLRDLLVRSLDEDGGLELRSQIEGRASVVQRVPVEAEGKDEDGVTIHMLLHVVEGRPAELEFFREDGATVKRIPSPSEFELIVLPPMPTKRSWRVLLLALTISLAILAFSKPVFGATDEATPGHFVEVENGKIYYEECGTGPDAVVLIHDGIAHSAVWDAVWPAFCKQFHIIRYDRRGYGRSPAATTWYYEIDDLYTLLRDLKVSHAFLVGSSHGGELTIDFTLAHPKLVDGMILVGAVVSGYGYSDHFLNRGIANSKPMEKNDSAAAISNWANDKYVLAADHREAKNKLLEILTAAPQDLNHPDFSRPTPDSLPRLGEIRVPTLILVGDADIPDVHSHAGVIEAGIPNSRRIVVDDAGHLMYLEKPEEFTRLTITFIQSNRF